MLIDDNIFSEIRRDGLVEGNVNLAPARPWQWQPSLPTPVYFSLPCRLKKKWETSGEKAGNKREPSATEAR